MEINSIKASNSRMTRAEWGRRSTDWKWGPLSTCPSTSCHFGCVRFPFPVTPWPCTGALDWKGIATLFSSLGRTCGTCSYCTVFTILSPTCRQVQNFVEPFHTSPGNSSTFFTLKFVKIDISIFIFHIFLFIYWHKHVYKEIQTAWWIKFVCIFSYSQ